MNKLMLATAGAIVAPVAIGAERVSSDQRVSRPGVYRGYTQAVADAFTRHSRYVTVSDGCRLAIDVLRPTLQGTPLSGPLPAVALFTGYRRSWVMGEREVKAVRHTFKRYATGELASFAFGRAKLPDFRHAVWPPAAQGLAPDALAAWLLNNGGSEAEYLLTHGYVFIIADTRATGASFGKPSQQAGTRMGHDISDVFDALAKEPWSDGSFGMTGASWHGIMQHFAITYGAPRLKAVMPQVAPHDEYLELWGGGIFNVGMMRDWLELTASEDSVSPSMPVDEDPDATLRDAALAERNDGKASRPAMSQEAAAATLEAMAPLTRDQFQATQGLADQPFAHGAQASLAQSPLDFARANVAKIPTYEIGGWWDIYASETPVAFANLKGARKLLMGPWHHGNLDTLIESRRWFDHWLKGVPNGIDSELAVTYGVSQSNGAPVWRRSDTFPPPGTRQLPLYPDGMGRLAWEPAKKATRALVVDPDTTAGGGSRGWGFAVADQLNYSGLQQHRAGQIRFESAPLTRSMEIAGYPVMTVEVSSSSAHAQLFVFLVAIDAANQAHLLSEGQLDLSFRDEQPAAFDTLGQPYRTFFASTAKPLVPGEFVTVRIPLMPVAWKCAPGERLALIMAGADKANAYQSPATLARELTLRVGLRSATHIEIPISGHAAIEENSFPELPSGDFRAVDPFVWND